MPIKACIADSENAWMETWYNCEGEMRDLYQPGDDLFEVAWIIAEEVVRKFNGCLQPGEQPRRLLQIVTIEWGKLD